MRSTVIVIRNTRSILTQTVMAKQRSSLISFVNLKARILLWRSKLTLELRQTAYH